MMPLPQRVRVLLDELGAPPRLVAHLTLVHQVANGLTEALSDTWPTLHFDRQAVLLGAATHNIGKVFFRNELREPGTAHEAAGELLLQHHGFSQNEARFARTHGQWQDDPAPPTPEDLIFALADTIWKGKRDDCLETAVTAWIAHARTQERWEVYQTLDRIMEGITHDADHRLAWQAGHATETNTRRPHFD